MLFEEEFDLILDATKLELIKTRVFPPQKVKKDMRNLTNL